jgi:YidC/Oxa1 family membrane protein insertase
LPEFKNPNQSGGGQDSRGLLVMVLVFVVAMFGTQWWMHKDAPPTPAETTPVATKSAAPVAPAANATAAQGVATTPSIAASGESTTVVENELYKITFSNRGGVVTSWILKKYKTIDGRPLDMVSQAGAKNIGYPLSLYSKDNEGLMAGLSKVLFVPSATGTLQAPATLKFKYSANGITVQKTFTFGADYVIHADASVLRNGQPIRALLAWPGGLGSIETLAAYNGAVIDTSVDDKFDQIAMKHVDDGTTLDGPFDFAGTSGPYFAATFIPDHPADATVDTLHRNLMTDFHGSSSEPMPANQVFVPAGDDGRAPKGSKKIALPFLGVAVGSVSGHDSLRLFVGPKSLTVLKSVATADGHNLGPVLDFGFWGPIAKILFLGIQWVHTHLASNWGWAIIIFTFLINLIVLPLRVQGMKSSMKMQKLQPEIDAIKAKYGKPSATSPKAAEMNAEVMAYQKSQGVSMFGGCIPSLIQFPLLIAFFYMMVRVVELRQAHWYYLHDLSQPDPYHILPILMVATSFLAQYYTPSPGVDPAQQKMMAFMMPAFSGWMTWNYASGLALYWNVGNIIMIVQQQVMNRTKLGLEMKEVAAKRAKARTLGKTSPKTIQGRK